MGHRLSKIYTRTGDAGTTGLGDGSRTAKDSARITAMGDVDELNSLLGVILCEDLPADVRGNAGDKSAIPADSNWRRTLEREVAASLARGEKEIFDGLNRSFEAALITKALEHTGGRRIEAALLLGIGRNTLTRKIQDLGLDGGADT